MRLPTALVRQDVAPGVRRDSPPLSTYAECPRTKQAAASEEHQTPIRSAFRALGSLTETGSNEEIDFAAVLANPLGHTSIRTTIVYTHVRRDQIGRVSELNRLLRKLKP